MVGWLEAAQLEALPHRLDRMTNLILDLSVRATNCRHRVSLGRRVETRGWFCLIKAGRRSADLPESSQRVRLRSVSSVSYGVWI